MTNSKKFLIAGWSLYLIFIVIGFLVDKRGGGYYGPVIPLIIFSIFVLGTIFLLIGFKRNISRFVLIIGILIVWGVLLNNSNSEPRRYDGSIRAMVGSMRSQAELQATGAGDNWHYPANLCDQDNGPMSDLFKGLTSYKARDIRCFVSSDLKSWAASVKLRDSNDLYCSDSTSFNYKVLQSITGPVCGHDLQYQQTDQETRSEIDFLRQAAYASFYVNHSYGNQTDSCDDQSSLFKDSDNLAEPIKSAERSSKHQAVCFSTPQAWAVSIKLNDPDVKYYCIDNTNDVGHITIGNITGPSCASVKVGTNQ